MNGACMTSTEELPPPTGKGPTRPCLVTTLNGSVPHALVYDQTHDNVSPLDKRSAEDALSIGALATFSYSAIGSVKGFDELYPKLLDLVTEKRLYELVGVEAGSGIGRAKRLLNALHTEMVLGGYEEGHVHQENEVRVWLIFRVRVFADSRAVYRDASRSTANAKGVSPCRTHGIQQRFEGPRLRYVLCLGTVPRR